MLATRALARQPQAIVHNIVTVELTRDCNAVQIPHGTTSTLPKGTAVDITQTLGGSTTLRVAGALFRIASGDADALGLPPDAATAAARPAAAGAAEVSEEQIWGTLKTCFDPEIPVNIVDLGLVYDMQLSKLPFRPKPCGT